MGKGEGGSKRELRSLRSGQYFGLIKEKFKTVFPVSNSKKKGKIKTTVNDNHVVHKTKEQKKKNF